MLPHQVTGQEGESHWQLLDLMSMIFLGAALKHAEGQRSRL